MKFNRSILIDAIVKHQKVFFQLLDHIDKNDGALEVPESLYLNGYNNIICQNDDQNLHSYLSISSLVENGVFIEHNKGTGIISIESVIIDLLRFLDVKRARELTHSDFELMRAQIVDVVERIMNEPIGEQRFSDAMMTFNNLMSEIHSKIKENVTKLTEQVESLALRYKQYDLGSTEMNTIDLYNKVSDLHHRFVLPCYEFIDSNMDMVKTHSFSHSTQLLIDHFASKQNDRVDLANKVRFRRTAITSYYKDIAALAEKLERFSSRLEADRNTYMAIDSAFSQLMESIIPLRHGKKRNIYLAANADVFSHHSILDGLTSQKSKFGAKLRWDNNKTPIRLKEYLAVLDEKPLKRSHTGKVEPLPIKVRPNQDKQIKISRVIFNERIPKQILDVHLFLYELLETKVEDFSVADVLFGLEVFMPKYKFNITRNEVLTKKQLKDPKYFIDYIQIRYNREEVNV